MEKQITGMMIYYNEVCKRKLWYFYQDIKMEQGNENVQIGKLLDNYSYERDEKHINIDNVINIDFIRKEGILHEIKKSKKIEEANIWQVKYYLYYLQQRGVAGIRGRIDYPLLKQNIEVELEAEDISLLQNKIKDIHDVFLLESPPLLSKLKICKSCAYFDLCFI